MTYIPPPTHPQRQTVLNNRCYHCTSHPTKPPRYTTKGTRKHSLVAMQLDFPQLHSLVAMQLDFLQLHSLVAMQLDFPQQYCCCATILIYIGWFG